MNTSVFAYQHLEVRPSLTDLQVNAVWHEIERDSARQWFVHDGFPKTIDEFREMCQGTLLAVFLDGNLAGVGWAQDERWPIAFTVKLLYVMPAWRGTYALHIGKALIHTAVSALKYENIYTTTHPDHHAARAYNLALGFTRVGVLPGEGRHNGEAVDLELYSLRPPQPKRG